MGLYIGDKKFNCIFNEKIQLLSIAENKGFISFDQYILKDINNFILIGKEVK